MQGLELTGNARSCSEAASWGHLEPVRLGCAEKRQIWTRGGTMPEDQTDRRIAELEDKLKELERCNNELREQGSEQWSAIKQGYSSNFEWLSATDGTPPHTNSNALREFFGRRKQGPGIWKWNHYFDIYDRHFRRFRGKEVHVLEIG